MTENLGKFLLKMRINNKNKMETGLKEKFIGDWGELFVANYLYELFEANNIKNDIAPHNNNNDDYDLDIYLNGRKYIIEVKFSTIKDYPQFYEIHFNNDFKYLFLIWHPSDDKIYFAILNRKEAKGIATEMHPGMNEDNWVISRTDIFDENNQNFLNDLSEKLELNEELEDITEERKLELVYGSKEEIMKNPNAVKNDFSGETYQEWFYDYLRNYIDNVEIMPRGYKYDIKYKGKGIEVKYSALHGEGTFKFFKFDHIKPKLFDFIFLIGFDDEENKFYFSIKTSDEIVEIKRELAGTDEFFSENGFELGVGKHSIVNFVNDFTFEDFDKYIETH